jgi:hypothetical protein
LHGVLRLAGFAHCLGAAQIKGLLRISLDPASTTDMWIEFLARAAQQQASRQGAGKRMKRDGLSGNHGKNINGFCGACKPENCPR